MKFAGLIMEIVYLIIYRVLALIVVAAQLANILNGLFYQ